MMKPSDVDSALHTIDLGLKTAKIMKDKSKSRSISRLSKDSIVQYPILMSNAIPAKEAMQIVKGLETQIAGMLVAYLSTANRIDLNKYENPGEFIKQFHNSSAMPYDINFANDLITGLAREAYGYDEDATLEASFVAYGTDRECPYSKDAVLECWDTIDAKIETGKLNDLYKPFEKTKIAMKAATEAISDYKEANRLQAEIKKLPKGDPQRDALQAELNKLTGQVHTPLNNALGDFNKGLKKDSMVPYASDPNNSKMANAAGCPPITNNPKMEKGLTEMAPTTVSCQFLCTGGAGESRLINTVFAVKAMPRLLSSDIMIKNIVAGFGSGAIFKFIKWAKGELKFVRDIIFGISDAKADAKVQKTAEKVFVNLRKLKRQNKIGQVTKQNIPATTCIVIEDYEAEIIQQNTGFDLRDARVAKQFIDKHFILGFGIYNKQTEVFSFIFDGYEDFSDVSINALRNANKQDTSLNDLSNVLKNMGRF